MFYVTDAVTKNRVAISPTHVVAVFKIPEVDAQGNKQEMAGHTGINLVNGSIVCQEEDYAVVAEINNSQGVVTWNEGNLELDKA
jgi:hypothetical protein